MSSLSFSTLGSHVDKGIKLLLTSHHLYVCHVIITYGAEFHELKLSRKHFAPRCICLRQFSFQRTSASIRKYFSVEKRTSHASNFSVVSNEIALLVLIYFLLFLVQSNCDKFARKFVSCFEFRWKQSFIDSSSKSDLPGNVWRD